MYLYISPGFTRKLIQFFALLIFWSSITKSFSSEIIFGLLSTPRRVSRQQGQDLIVQQLNILPIAAKQVISKIY